MGGGGGTWGGGGGSLMGQLGIFGKWTATGLVYHVETPPTGKLFPLIALL